MIDWKEQLGAAFGIAPEENDTSATPQPQTPLGDAAHQQGRRPVHIAFERKGRAGKQATIITDLVADDEALKSLAATLKRACGVGGSARGGEILLQGDVRERARQELQNLGFNVK